MDAHANRQCSAWSMHMLADSALLGPLPTEEGKTACILLHIGFVMKLGIFDYKVGKPQNMLTY